MDVARGILRCAMDVARGILKVCSGCSKGNTEGVQWM